MKLESEIIKIINQHSPEVAATYILEFLNEWNDPYDNEPPHDIEILAKSPTGSIHLTSWRPAYNIFVCQCKGEPSYMWKWKLIN